ncbi:hypothetical protein AMTRI_Chr11g95140 [Amborella trichopoda]
MESCRAWVRFGSSEPARKRSAVLRTKQAGRGSCRGS